MTMHPSQVGLSIGQDDSTKANAVLKTRRKKNKRATSSNQLSQVAQPQIKKRNVSIDHTQKVKKKPRPRHRRDTSKASVKAGKE